VDKVSSPPIASVLSLSDNDPGKISVNARYRVLLKQQDESLAAGLCKTTKGPDPSVDRRWGQRGIAFWVSRRDTIDPNGLLVCHLIELNISRGKAHDTGAGIVLVGNRKIGVIGKRLSTAGTNEPKQGTENSFNPNLYDNQETALTVSMNLEELRGNIAP